MLHQYRALMPLYSSFSCWYIFTCLGIVYLGRNTELHGWITRTYHWAHTVQFTHFVDCEVCLPVILYYNLNTLVLTQVSEVVLLHDALWLTFYMFPPHLYMPNVPHISASWRQHSNGYNNSRWTVNIVNTCIMKLCHSFIISFTWNILRVIFCWNNSSVCFTLRMSDCFL
jgi:hypothetical protein